MMKLLFDANISQHAVKALGVLLKATKQEVTITHTTEHFHQSAADSEFIAGFVKDGYLLVTGDSGKQSGLKEKLPVECVKAGMNHILLTAKFQQQSSFEKMRAVIYIWPELQAAFDAPKGSRFKLQQAGKGFTLKAAS